MVRLFYYFSEARLTRIAEAIRYKTGEQVEMTIAEMPDKIASIEGGGGGGPENYISFVASITEPIGGTFE